MKFKKLVVAGVAAASVLGLAASSADAKLGRCHTIYERLTNGRELAVEFTCPATLPLKVTRGFKNVAPTGPYYILSLKRGQRVHISIAQANIIPPPNICAWDAPVDKPGVGMVRSMSGCAAEQLGVDFVGPVVLSSRVLINPQRGIFEKVPGLPSLLPDAVALAGNLFVYSPLPSNYKQLMEQEGLTAQPWPYDPTRAPLFPFETVTIPHTGYYYVTLNSGYSWGIPDNDIDATISVS
jgi:hypothetical protein